MMARPGILAALCGEPFVHFHPAMADIAGSLAGGIMLSKAAYWTITGKTGKGGWISKTREEWEQETSANRWAQESARRLLRNRLPDIWFERRAGVPPLLLVRIDQDRLEVKIEEALQCRQVRRQSKSGNTSYWMGGKPSDHSAAEPPMTGGEASDRREVRPPINPLQNIEQIKERATSSSTEPPPDLVAGLQSLVGITDDDAVSKLLRECRMRDPEATEQEILLISTEKIAAANGSARNLMGFLLTAVPKCFEGESIAAFREERRRRGSTTSANGGEPSMDFSRESIRDYIGETAELIRRSAANHPSGKRRLESSAGSLERIALPSSPDIKVVHDQLTAQENKLYGILVDLAGPEMLERLGREIEKQTARTQSKMTNSQREAFRENCLRPRLFKEFMMPRICLDHVAGANRRKGVKDKNTKRSRSGASESLNLFEHHR
jgi:hypothetical protein